MATPCEEIKKEKLKKLSELLLRNSKGKITAVLDLIYNAGGDFLLLAADYIVQMVGNSAASYLSVAIASVLSPIQNAVAATFSSMMIVNELANKTVLQYLRAISLREALEYRRDLIRAMQIDIDFLISILNSLIGLSGNLNAELFEGIEEAKEELDSAIRILGVEIFRMQTTNKRANNQSVTAALNHLERSLEYLNRGASATPTLIRSMQGLHKKHGLDYKGIKIPVLSPGSIEDYIKDVFSPITGGISGSSD